MSILRSKKDNTIVLSFTLTEDNSEKELHINQVDEHITITLIEKGGDIGSEEAVKNTRAIPLTGVFKAVNVEGIADTYCEFILDTELLTKADFADILFKETDEMIENLNASVYAENAGETYVTEITVDEDGSGKELSLTIIQDSETV